MVNWTNFSSYCQQKWEELELTYQDTEEWIPLGFKPDDYKEVKRWKDRGFDHQQTKEWKEILGGSFKVGSSWAFCVWLRDEKHLTIQEVQQQNNLEELKNEYNKLWTDIHSDFSKAFQPNRTNKQCWEEANLTYQDAQEWVIKEKGFKPNDWPLVRDWKNHNFTPQETKSWMDFSLDRHDYEFASYLKQNNITPEQHASYKKKTPQEQLDYFYAKTQVKTIDLKYLNFNQPSELILDNYPNLKGIKGWDTPNLTKITITNCSQLERIDIKNSENLQQLILHNLPSLREFDCWVNKLTNLDLTHFPNLERISCSNNQLTEIKLPITAKEKLKSLSLHNNNLQQDLSFLSSLVNLRELDLVGNKFYGSLEPLENMDKLWSLDIRDTDIDNGLKHLPENVERFYCSTVKRENAKVKVIEEKFKRYFNGEIKDYQKWKKSTKDILSRTEDIQKNIHQFFSSYSNQEISNLKDPQQVESRANFIWWTKLVGRSVSASGGAVSLAGGFLKVPEYSLIGGGIGWLIRL